MRIFAVSAVALALTACASEQERQAQAQAQAAAMQANDDAQCRSYGAVPGSPEYIQCRMNIDNQRAAMRQMIAGQLVGNMLRH